MGLVGAVYAVRGGITIGQLSVFLSYANQYTKPFNEISGVVTELQDPPSLLPEMLELLFSGEYDCAATRRTTREGEPPVRSLSLIHI